MKISTKKLFVIHLLIWSVLELLVNPIGDFPLNDDWAYYQNVYYLSEEGRFFFSDWLAMTLVLQVLWGAFVCKIFGFSFTVLRMATIFLSVLGSWSCFLFFKNYCKDKLLAYAAALLLVINPIYFSLTNSFMTEIHFLSVFIPGLYCFVRYVDGKNNRMDKYWWGGLLFSMMATMIRQPGLVLPLAFALTYLWKHAKAFSVPKLLVAFLPLICSFSIYKIYSFWLLSTQTEMPVYGEIGQLFRPFWNGSLGYKLTVRNANFLFYCGYFLLPLTLYLWNYYQKTSTTLQKISAALIALLLSSSCFLKFHLFPMGNMIGNLWLGPKTLFNSFGQSDTSAYVLSENVWLVVKGIGILAGVFLIFQLVLATYRHYYAKRWSIAMLVVIMFGYYAFLILNPYYNDRYNLIFVPLLVAILLADTKVLKVPMLWKGSSLFVFAILLFYSVAGTHDYLSWNREAWRISESVEQKLQISPKQIQGGFEYSSWHNNPTFLPDSSILSKDSSQYATSFEPILCGWTVQEKHPYFQWTFMRDTYIYLHQKNESNFSKRFVCDVEGVTSVGGLLTSDSTIVLPSQAPRDSTVFLSGNNSIRLDEKTPYSFTVDLDRSTPCYEITATIWRKIIDNPAYPDKKFPSVIVVSTDDYYYHNANIINTRPDGWEQIECRIELSGHTTADKVKINLWNNSGNVQWFDDFEVRLEW